MKMYLNGTQVGLRDADQPDLSPGAMPFYVGETLLLVNMLLQESAKLWYTIVR